MFVLFAAVLFGMDTRFPDHISENAIDLIKGLLAGDERQRLGGRGEKHDELRAHPFFNDIDWVTTTIITICIDT